MAHGFDSTGTPMRQPTPAKRPTTCACSILIRPERLVISPPVYRLETIPHIPTSSGTPTRTAESFEVIGTPIPACESDPISRGDQIQNMENFLRDAGRSLASAPEENGRSREHPNDAGEDPAT